MIITTWFTWSLSTFAGNLKRIESIRSVLHAAQTNRLAMTHCSSMRFPSPIKIGPASAMILTLGCITVLLPKQWRRRASVRPFVERTDGNFSTHLQTFFANVGPRCNGHMIPKSSSSAATNRADESSRTPDWQLDTSFLLLFSFRSKKINSTDSDRLLAQNWMSHSTVVLDRIGAARWFSDICLSMGAFRSDRWDERRQCHATCAIRVRSKSKDDESSFHGHQSSRCLSNWRFHLKLVR